VIAVSTPTQEGYTKYVLVRKRKKGGMQWCYEVYMHARGSRIYKNIRRLKKNKGKDSRKCKDRSKM